MAVQLTALVHYLKKTVLDKPGNAPPELLFPDTVLLCLGIGELKLCVMKNLYFLTSFPLVAPFSTGKEQH